VQSFNVEFDHDLIFFSMSQENSPALPELPSVERNQNAQLGVLYFFVFQGLLVGIYSANIPVFRDSLGLSDWTLGLVTPFVSLGYISFVPISAGLIRSYGSKRVSLLGSQLYGLGLGIIGLAGTLHGSNAFFLAAACYIFGSFMGLMDIGGFVTSDSLNLQDYIIFCSQINF
jgi:MFS family permease